MIDDVVPVDEKCFATGIFDLAERFMTARFVQIGNDEACAFACEDFGRCAPDSGAGAGN